MTAVLIAVPTGRSGWAPDFTMSLLELLTRPMAADLGLPEEPILRWSYHRSSNVCQNRHNLVRGAQKLGVSHILWLDDDMTFPADTLVRLLKHDRDIVTANCTTRAVPIVPTAIKRNQRIPSIGRRGLEIIDQVGLAVVLTRLEVFENVALPWFLFVWDPEFPDTYMTEDCYFFRKARAAGLDVWVDHDVSQEIGHIGELEFSHGMIDVKELAAFNRDALLGRREKMRLVE